MDKESVSIPTRRIQGLKSLTKLEYCIFINIIVISIMIVVCNNNWAFIIIE